MCNQVIWEDEERPRGDVVSPRCRSNDRVGGRGVPGARRHHRQRQEDSGSGGVRGLSPPGKQTHTSLGRCDARP